MWLVDRHTLMTLPEGTLYTEEPGSKLMVKGETMIHDGINGDWVELNLSMATSGFGIDGPEELGDSSRINDEGWQRNGCYSDEDRFLVYEKYDLEVLEKFIKAAKTNY